MRNGLQVMWLIVMHLHFGVLLLEHMIIGFPCTKIDDSWNVKIPPIASFGIDPKSYLIEGVMEGHYFNILNGTVECTESEKPTKIAASEPKKVESGETEKENDVIPPQDDYSFPLGKKEDNEKKAEKPEVGIKAEPKRIKTENLDEIVSKILTETAKKTPDTISKEKDSIVKQLLSESKKKSGTRFKKGNVVTK